MNAGAPATGGRTTVNVTKLIDEAPVTGFLIAVVILCGLVAFLEGYDIQALAYADPVLSADLGVETPVLGPVFSAFLVGVVAGNVFLGPLADRIGRRNIIIASTVLFGLGSLATAFADSLTALLILRVITGIGIGGATNIIPLTNEYTPARRKATIGLAMFAGVPVGSVVGGLASSVLLPTFGWRSVFVLGGILPVLLAVVLVFALPESVRFLVARSGGDARVRRIAQRISREPIAADAEFTVLAQEKPKGNPVSALFRDGRALTTILLWLACFANFAGLYFLLSWIPSVLTGAGMPLGTAILAGTVFSLGGIVGSIILGIVMDRVRRRVLVLAAAALLAFVGILIVPALLPAPAPTFILVFILGIGVIATQNGLLTLSGMLYPTLVRSTGVGWANAVGRVGSIISPTVGGLLIAAGWTAPQIFTAVLVPVGIYLVVFVVLGLRRATIRAEEQQTAVPAVGSPS